MLLVLCFLGFIFYYYYLRLDKLCQQIKTREANVSLSECRLEAFNIMCHECRWMPTFVKVYLIGIAETLYIVLVKRGLFKGSTRLDKEAQVDELVQNNVVQEPRLAVLIGGDSGIGFEICKGLLLANYHVIIGTRSTSTCEAVIKELKGITGSDKVSCIEVDLTVFKSVHEFATNVKKQVSNKKIQLLINNAGIMNIPYTMSVDGYESQCQTNYLSPFLLTQLLLPFMDTQSGRILFASSSTMYAERNISTAKATAKYTLNGLDHYAHSKSCVAHLVQELAKTLSIPVNSYHPGTVRTKLFAYTTVFNLPLVSKLFDFIMLSPKEGSKTPLYLCLTKDLDSSGGYWANERSQTIPSIRVNGNLDDGKALLNDTLTKCKIKV